MWEHLIGLRILEEGAKITDHLTGGACRGTVEILEEVTSSPGYLKYRIDCAQETLSDFWDDHKEDVIDFFDNVGDTVNDGLEAVGDFLGDAANAIGDNLGDILGSLIS